MVNSRSGSPPPRRINYPPLPAVNSAVNTPSGQKTGLDTRDPSATGGFYDATSTFTPNPNNTPSYPTGGLGSRDRFQASIPQNLVPPGSYPLEDDANRQSDRRNVTGHIRQSLGFNDGLFREESRTLEPSPFKYPEPKDGLQNNKGSILHINEKLDRFIDETRKINNQNDQRTQEIVRMMTELPDIIGNIPGFIQRNAEQDSQLQRMAAIIERNEKREKEREKRKRRTTTFADPELAQPTTETGATHWDSDQEAIDRMNELSGDEGVETNGQGLSNNSNSVRFAGVNGNSGGSGGGPPQRRNVSGNVFNQGGGSMGQRPPTHPGQNNVSIRHRSGTPSDRSNATSSSHRVKREEVGIFDPHADDPNGTGMFYDGKNYMFTDVFSFQDRVLSFLQNPLAPTDIESQLLSMFQTLLAGPALIWWTNELVAAERSTYIESGIEEILDKLIARFSPNVGDATKAFLAGHLRLKDVAQDEQALDKVNEARSQIVSLAKHRYPNATPKKWDPGHQDVLRPAGYSPRPHNGDFRDGRDDDRRRSGRRRDRFRSRDRGSSRSRDRNRDRDHRRSRDNSRDNRDRRDRSRDDNDRYKKKDDRDKDGKDRKKDSYKKDSVHFTEDDDRKIVPDAANFASDRPRDESDEDSSSYYSSSDEAFLAVEEEADLACTIIDRHLTCHKCHKVFENPAKCRQHVRQCSPFKAATAEGIKELTPHDPGRRTCGHCHQLCSSRNNLFKHLKHCKAVKESSQEAVEQIPSESKEDALLFAEPAEAFEISDAPNETQETDDNPLSSFTHLRAPAKLTPDGPILEICFDGGASRSVVNPDFLKNHEYSISKRKGGLLTPNGVKGVQDWATFSFHLVGTNVLTGKPTLKKVTKSAWVSKNLPTNLILANDFMKPHGAAPHYGPDELHFDSMPDFRMKFAVTRRANPCDRKVTTTKKTMLLPNQHCLLAVEFKPLPTDRSLAFNSEHSAALHAVVDAKTPKVIAVQNNSDGLIVIPKGTKVGRISEIIDSGYVKTNWASASRVLALATVGLAYLTGYQAPETVSRADIRAAVASAPSPMVGSEFPLSAPIRAVAERALEKPPEIELPPSHGTGNASDHTLSLSDQVFAITQGNRLGSSHATMLEKKAGPLAKGKPALLSPIVNVPGETTIDADRDASATQPDVPNIPEKHSTLGLKVEDNLPEIVTIDGVHIYSENPSLADRFKNLVSKYPKVWVNKGLIDMPEEEMMKIPLVEGWNNHKLASKSYPLSRRDREVLDKIFGELQDQGRMEYWNGASPFAASVFVVWRTVHGQAKGRVVIDLRPLNRVAIPDNYPLPLQAEIINSLRGKKFITAIDATSFFYQFGVYPPHRDRLTVISPRGIERSNVALMGYRNSPAYVQRFMDNLLRPYNTFARSYIDDMVIYSDTAEEHLKHLETIFKLFVGRNIAINPKKSFIGYPSVELLGFRVDSLGLTNTADRVKAFRELAFPNQLKALEQYIGASGFLRHLIPYYAQIVEPLQRRKVQLLAEGRKQGKVVNGNKNGRKAYVSRTYFNPSQAEKLAFKSLQAAICEGIKLAHHDPSKTLILQVDGSLERGFGVMVYHLEDEFEKNWKPGEPVPSKFVRPIMFLSRCLTDAELRYGPSELEVACLVWACKKLRTMLHSSSKTVVVLTDHSATKGIVENISLCTASTDRANKRLINASVYLSQYDLKVFHLPGRLNYVPDALSRLRTVWDTDQRPKGEAVLDNVWFTFAEAVMEPSLQTQFEDGYANDRKYQAVFDDLKQYPSEVAGVFSRRGYPFTIVNGLLYNIRADGSRSLCIPQNMVKDILASVHDDKHHFGRDRMLYDLRGVSIPRKTKQVEKYIHHCHGCGINATSHQQPAGEMNPIKPSETLPMSVIAIDFIVGLPSVPSDGTFWQKKGFSSYNQLLTVSCKASKRTLLIPGNDKYTAEDWGEMLIACLLYAEWGIPQGIISDRDRKFTSGLWKGIWKALSTRLLMTTAYHPQGDGMAERKNQTVELAVRYYSYYHPGSSWVDALIHIQWNLNSSYASAIESTPHEQLFGFRLPGPLGVLTHASEPKISKVLRDNIRQDAHLAMDFAAAAAKRLYDAKHKPVEFNVGDKVWLRLHQGYNLPGKPSRKYSAQRNGPWTVLKKVGRLAYELDFPESMKIHPVVSVAHLSPAPTNDDPFGRDVPPPGPVIDEQDPQPKQDIYELEAVMKHKVVHGKYKYLVRWKGYDGHHDQWIKEDDMTDAADLVEDYWKLHGGKPSTPGPVKPSKSKTRKPAPVVEEDTESGVSGSDSEDDVPVPDFPPIVIDLPMKRGRGRPRKTPSSQNESQQRIAASVSQPLKGTNVQPGSESQGTRRSSRLSQGRTD